MTRDRRYRRRLSVMGSQVLNVRNGCSFFSLFLNISKLLLNKGKNIFWRMFLTIYWENSWQPLIFPSLEFVTSYSSEQCWGLARLCKLCWEYQPIRYEKLFAIFFPWDEREELFLEQNRSTSPAKRTHRPEIGYLYSRGPLVYTFRKTVHRIISMK